MPSESFQQRLESLYIKVAEESLRRSEIEREIAETNRESARLCFDAVKARIATEMIESAERTKLAQISVQHYREYQRPSRQPGVEIKHVASDQWVAELGDIHATGDTPAMAASEFDHIWVFGDERNRSINT